MSKTTYTTGPRKKPAPKRLEQILIERSPPHNLEAEIGVLGAILLNPLVCDDVTTILRADDFYADHHKTLYRHLQEMHTANTGIDITLLLNRLEQNAELENVGGYAYIAELMSRVAVTAHAVHYAEIVHDKAILRDLIHTGVAILSEAYESDQTPRQIVSRAEQKVFAINDSRSSTQAVSMDTIIHETLGILNTRSMRGGMDGVLTGFVDLDEMTAGLHPNELIILAARPSMGKTALATNIADNAAIVQRKSTLLFSLEMSKEELAIRMLGARARIDGNKFKSCFLSQAERARLATASAELAGASIHIDDTPGRTVTEIAAVARRLKRKQGLDLIIIDYLTLIQADNESDPRQEQVAKIARRLKGVARELQVPVLCLAQLNRQTEATKDNRPRLSHLRDSGAIEQDADVVMFVHREEYYHKREDAEDKGLIGKAEILIAKQRNGPVGDVPLAWMSEFTRFDNLAKSYQEGYTEFAPYASDESF